MTAQIRIGRQTRERLCERVGLAGRDEQTGALMLDYVAAPSDIGGDQWQPGRPCFEQEPRQPLLVVGGQDGDVRRPDELVLRVIICDNTSSASEASIALGNELRQFEDPVAR